jgi:hypothetical protein
MKKIVIVLIFLALSCPVIAGNTHYATATDEQHKQCLDPWNAPMLGPAGERCRKWQAWCKAKGYTNYTHESGRQDVHDQPTQGYAGNWLRCIP